MHVKSLAVVFLLLLSASISQAQQRLSLAERPSNDKLAAAKDLIKSAETAPTKLKVGGWATIDIKLPGKLTVYITPGSDDCIQKILIPKGQAYEGWLVDDATGVFKWTRIEPSDVDRVLITGLSRGTATLIWMGVKGDEAVVVAAFQFAVAGGTPKPVDPVDPDPTPSTDALVLAAQADIKAGKGTAEDVDNYASLFSMYASQVKNGDTLNTIGDLFKEMDTSIDRLLGKDIDKCFPTLRRAVGAELRAKLPTNPATKIDRFAVASELLIISKRLVGVK